MEIAMDSINRNQPEQNYETLAADEAISKIKEIVEKAQTCFFCTTLPDGQTHSRPMSVQQVDDEGNLWFLSAEDSHKNMEVTLEPTVKLYFQGSTHSDFLELTGHAHISRDRQKIKEKALMIRASRSLRSLRLKVITGTPNMAMRLPVSK
jgi:pyridoxine/pyridoxamine 5'-phosphate oxidase